MLTLADADSAVLQNTWKELLHLTDSALLQSTWKEEISDLSLRAPKKSTRVSTYASYWQRRFAQHMKESFRGKSKPNQISDCALDNFRLGAPEEPRFPEIWRRRGMKLEIKKCMLLLSRSGSCTNISVSWLQTVCVCTIELGLVQYVRACSSIQYRHKIVPFRRKTKLDNLLHDIQCSGSMVPRTNRGKQEIGELKQLLPEFLAVTRTRLQKKRRLQKSSFQFEGCGSTRYNRIPQAINMEGR